MITVKLGELRGIVERLNEILNEKLPIKTAYSFGKLARKVQKEYTLFEENRKRIIEAHGKRDQDGNLVEKDSKYVFDDLELFNEKFMELAAIDLEIDFVPLTLEQLGDISVTPVALAVLGKFIVEAE